MKKRLLLLLFVALSILPIYAHDFEADGICYHINSGTSTCAVTHRDEFGNSYSGDIIIPESVTYNGTEYSVTSIGDNAFYDSRELISVEITNSVTSIGSYAFWECSSLTSITIPNSVTEIGNYAFEYCSGLTSVEIPNSVTSIGNGAFANCTSLTEFHVNSLNTFDKIIAGVKYKCSFAVYDGVLYEALIALDGENINSYQLHLVQYPAGKTNDTFTIPSYVTQIRPYAFSGCSGLTSVEIPNSVTEIGSSAFYGCIGLTSVEIPNSVTEIGNEAFRDCTNLTSVTIPNSVTSIGDGAFERCSGLTSIEIPNSVTEIGWYAFFGCIGLTSVEIPNSVTEIGNEAFRDCTNLTSVTIPYSVTEIGSQAFYGCSGLTSVTIPNSVTEIGYAAFWGCSELTSITIPNSVTYIGTGAFANCTSLTEFCVNSLNTYDRVIDGVTYKCSFAVYDGVLYEALIALDGENINSYQLHLVQYPAGKTNDTFIIPSYVTQIRPNAFSGCIGLTSVTIPNSVTEIGTVAFSGCPGLTSVTYLAENPIESYSYIFSDETYENATLNYLESAADKIDSTTPWNLFKNRVGRSADFVDADIEEISCVSNEITEVYNLSGIKVGDSLNGLPKGVYIVRQGAKTTKLAI